jgi:hypothetical protein
MTGLKRVRLRRPGRELLAGLGPRRGQGLDDGPAADPVLLLDCTAGHPRAGIPADRCVKLDLRRGHGGRSFVTKRIHRLTMSHIMRSEPTNNDFTKTGPRSPLTNRCGHITRTKPPVRLRSVRGSSGSSGIRRRPPCGCRSRLCPRGPGQGTGLGVRRLARRPEGPPEQGCCVAPVRGPGGCHGYDLTPCGRAREIPLAADGTPDSGIAGRKDVRTVQLAQEEGLRRP